MKKDDAGNTLQTARGKALKKILTIALGGVAAGFLNGLFGAGGGIAAVLALSAALPRDAESQRSVYANALCITLVLSVMTLTNYSINGKLSTDIFDDGYAPVLIAAALGGAAGAFVTGRLRSSTLDIIFAALTVLSGILML